MEAGKVENIADRIADIILSPDTIKGLINGALTVPLDLGYLAHEAPEVTRYCVHMIMT